MKFYKLFKSVLNQDLAPVALCDDDGTIIGYYEKHEYRNKETIGLYQPIR